MSNLVEIKSQSQIPEQIKKFADDEDNFKAVALFAIRKDGTYQVTAGDLGISEQAQLLLFFQAYCLKEFAIFNPPSTPPGGTS